MIQQVYSAGGGGECGGHCSHLAGSSPGHPDWEVERLPQPSTLLRVYMCVCVCVRLQVSDVCGVFLYFISNPDKFLPIAVKVL